MKGRGINLFAKKGTIVRNLDAVRNISSLVPLLTR